MEVLRAAAIARGHTLDELERVRAEKAEKRGRFEKKILLKTVSEYTDYSFLLKMQSYLMSTEQREKPKVTSKTRRNVLY